MINDTPLKNKPELFGILLFMLVTIILIGVYIALLFNKNLNWIGDIENLVLYVVFGMLFFSLIILMVPLFKRINESYRKRSGELKIKRLLNKKIKEEKKLRLRAEKKKLEAKKRRERELMLKEREEEKRKIKAKQKRDMELKLRKREEEKRKIKAKQKRDMELKLRMEKGAKKKEGFFSRLFRKRIKKKKEIKVKRIKDKPIKKEERKITYSKVKMDEKRKGDSYFISFLLSIFIFMVALFYNNEGFMIVAVILVMLSLFIYKKIKDKSKKKGEKKKEPKEEGVRVGKKEGFFSRLFKRKVKRSEKKEDIKGVVIKEEEKKIKQERIALVKKLPKGLKIERSKYDTDIDILYKIIKGTGRIKMSVITKYFGINQKKAEEWAAILEGHNLVKIHYPAVGEPELEKVDK